jgi:hypothetical protein
MLIQVLNSFHGDKEKDFDTTTEEGRAKASKFFEELLRSGSAIFLERDDEKGKRTTYRVTGYQPETDRVIVQLGDGEATPTDAEPVKKTGKGRPRAAVPASRGNFTAAAPVSGGSHGR